MRSYEPCQTTALICLLTVLWVCGCRQEPSRWEQAQTNSEGKTAQQSSADRLESGPGTQAQGAPDSPSSEPPPYTPGVASETDAPVTWTPKGAQRESTASPQVDPAALTTGAPLPGGEFNKFFPKQAGDYDMVAMQEKEGFAQYSLRRGGEEIGQLSVTDLRSDPQSAEKFLQPDQLIEGFPAKKDGSKGTTLLVGQRFQVKVRSPGGELNEADRVQWLKQFDLAGLAALAN